MQNYRDPRQGNQPGDYGQMAPYRDMDEDDTPARTMAQAIAPQPQAQPQPQGQAPMDTAQPMRAALQQPTARNAMVSRQGPSGSLGAMGAGMGALGGLMSGGGSNPQTGGVQRQSPGPLMPPGGQQQSGSLAGLATSMPAQLPKAPAPGQFADSTGRDPMNGGGVMGPKPQAPQAQPASWNTDGYAAPAQVAQNVRSQAPAGWDQDKWNNQDHQTPKYVWGRITQDDNPDDIAQLLAAYPGAQFDGKDKVSGIPGLGPIDVYQGASSGANVPQWLDINAAAAEGQGQQGARTMQQALGASSPEEEQYAQSLGLDTSNPMWRQILDQLTGEATNAPSRPDSRFTY